MKRYSSFGGGLAIAVRANDLVNWVREFTMLPYNSDWRGEKDKRE